MNYVTLPLRLPAHKWLDTARTREADDRARFKARVPDVSDEQLEGLYNWRHKKHSWRTRRRVDTGAWAPDTRGVYLGAYFSDDWPAARELGESHTIVTTMRHNGWYCDNYQEELVIGYVLQWPARNGDCLYFPGVRFTDSDGVTTWPADWYDTPEEAARAADHYAELIAEKSREYCEVDRRISSAEDAIEEAQAGIKHKRARHSQLCREVPTLQPTAAPVSCAELLMKRRRLRLEVKDYCGQLRKAREELEEAEADYKQLEGERRL